MGTRTYLLVSLLIIALTTANSRAHDESRHPEKPTVGEVMALSGDRITLKTDDGQAAVILGEATRIEQHGTVVDRKALRPGAYVSVFGTKLPTGELAAKEVHLEENVGHHVAAHK